MLALSELYACQETNQNCPRLKVLVFLFQGPYVSIRKMTLRHNPTVVFCRLLYCVRIQQNVLLLGDCRKRLRQVQCHVAFVTVVCCVGSNWSIMLSLSISDSGINIGSI